MIDWQYEFATWAGLWALGIMGAILVAALLSATF